ncbi:MAG: PilZ domain-containing protein [Acidobacteria bacterium]|nr:PilZ domain-containing protein [Acidobacteriota bacterium]
MGQPIKDRRSDLRYGWSRDDVSHATLRPGHVVHLIDLSAGGALVQTNRALRPGARVHFNLVLRQRSFALTARVLRCVVWTLDWGEGISYRGALQFEERCELFREMGPPGGSDIRVWPPSAEPNQAIG